MSWEELKADAENLDTTPKEGETMCRVSAENTGDEIIIRLYKGTSEARMWVCSFLMDALETQLKTVPVSAEEDSSED